MDSNAPDLSPADLDLMARTIATEDATPEGRAAVAHVILNRMKSSDYPNTASGVVLQRNAFEPVGSSRWRSLGPNSPDYQSAYAIARQAASGDIADPTGGSVLFYSPTAQAALGRPMPQWAVGRAPSTMIGGQAYYTAANAPAAKALSDDEIGAMYGGQQPQAKPLGDSDIEQMWSGPAAQAAAPASSPTGGFKGDTPEFLLGHPDNGPPQIEPDPGYGPQWLGGLRYTVPNALQATGEAYTNALAQRNRGLTEIGQGNYWPSGTVRDPSTWAAGGLLNTLMGAGGQIASPLTGLGRALIAEPTTQATGSPEIGERAGIVATSLAGPPIASAIGKGAGFVLPQVRAVNQLKSILGETPDPEIAARLSANPRLRLMDVDPEVQAHALGLATEPKYPSFGILKQSALDNAATAPSAASAAYDTAMGATPNVKTMLDDLAAKAQANAKAGYGAAFQNAKQVDISNVLDGLNKIEKPGVNAVVSTPSNIAPSTAQGAATDIKSLLTDSTGNMITDPQRLHEIQSQLRVSAEREAQRGDMQSGIRANVLNSARSNIIDALDNATDGKYSVARNQYRDDMSIPEAFDKGTTIYKNNTLEDRPEFWQAWKDQASPEELQAAKIGMRVAADQAINGTRFAARNGQNIPEVPFNFDKMRIILGDSEAMQLARTLADEKSQASTNALLFSGSKTGLTQAAQRATAVREPGAFSLLGSGTVPALLAHYFGSGDIGSALAAAAGVGANYAGRSLDIARNTAIARLAATPGRNALAEIYRERRLPLAAGLPAAALTGLGQLNESVNALTPSNR